MDDHTITNLVVGLVCAFILLSYHLWLASVVKSNPSKTVFGVTSLGRKAWVAAMMRDKKDILAVQSLRNLIMVSSILASTSIVLMFGFINFLSTMSATRSQTDQNAVMFGLEVDSLFGGKVMALLLVYCMSFFSFGQAMRFYNHVTMVININLPAQEIQHMQQQHIPERVALLQTSNIEFISGMLNRGSLYHTAGLRGYYLSFPIMGFLWGPWTLLVCTILLIGMLRVIDFNLDHLSPTKFQPAVPVVTEENERSVIGMDSGHDFLMNHARDGKDVFVASK
ncbi:hypothetical protein BDR26DRAFT_832148 [Obelidium mucronatum]|nr:hypothetical protein BDR26DRAFT_832148 [Obelidium mucronatum]